MSKSSLIDFRAVKAAITMEQMLQHYGLLDKFKKSGDSLSGPCPVHNGDNSTQFRVSLVKNIWNCFGSCKKGGNVLDFIAQMESVSIHAAALKAIEWFALDRGSLTVKSKEEEVPSPNATKSESSPPLKPAPEKSTPKETVTVNPPLKFSLIKLEKEHPYLTERGLTSETIADFGLGFCAKGMMSGRIAIPIRNLEGAVVAYAGRFPGVPPADTPKYKLPPGFRKSLEIFNIDRAVQVSKDKPLVVVEGFLDCMKLHQQGARKVVGLMGSTMSQAQEELIRKCTDCNSRVILILDEDEAGRAGREDIAVRLAKFVFVKIHVFGKEGQQPEHLSVKEMAALLA